MTFGKRLVELRRAHGYKTRTEFAEKIGVPNTTLRNYEEDKREPGHTFIKQMSEFFNVSSDYLLCLTEEPQALEPYRLTIEELRLVKQYRSLDGHGKRIVDMVLNEERARIAETSKPHLAPIAAHAHDGATPEELAEDAALFERHTTEKGKPD